jgi:Nitrile hydratase, alpha chain
MDRFERIDNQKEGASMAEQANESRRELEARLLDKALKDAAFRRALVEDPRGTLERELGVTVPDGVGLTVLQETPTARYLVLPLAPSRGDGMLTDAELEAVAGGAVVTYPGDCSTIGC